MDVLPHTWPHRRRLFRAPRGALRLLAGLAVLAIVVAAGLLSAPGFR